MSGGLNHVRVLGSVGVLRVMSIAVLVIDLIGSIWLLRGRDIVPHFEHQITLGMMCTHVQNVTCFASGPMSHAFPAYGWSMVGLFKEKFL